MSEVKIPQDQLFPFPSLDQLSQFEYTPEKIVSLKPKIPPSSGRLGEHYCGNCGSVRISGTYFCPQCGYPFPSLPRRPLGINIIMGLLVVGGILNIVTGISALSDPYLSNIPWLPFWVLFIGVFQIGVVYGLRRLKPWAGWAVMILYVLNIFGTFLIAITFPEALVDPVMQLVFSLVMAVIIIKYIYSNQAIFTTNEFHSIEDSYKE